MIDSEHKKIIERTDHSPRLYEAAFGRVLNQPTTEVIIDVAAGDSQFATERAARSGQRVIRVDRDYELAPPLGSDWLADDARALSLPDRESDVTVSAFLMQHLSPDDQQKAIAEMLRVTKPFDGTAQGVVGLFPVYRPEVLQRALDVARFDSQAYIMEDTETFEKGTIADRKLAKPTLWIPNQGTPEEQTVLIRLITESGAMTRRRTVADLARQAMMRRTGNNRISLS